MDDKITFVDDKQEPEDNSGPQIVYLNFADAGVPEFKEVRGKSYVSYGVNNLYPDELLSLYNKSGKQNAIINSKSKYIFGKGYKNGNSIINRLNESLNDISKKAILDIEIFGGFRFEVVFNKMGKIAEIYHVDYTCLRKVKGVGFLFKENWSDKYNRAEPVPIPMFNLSEPVGSQIFEYVEYRPGSGLYPLPGYLGCINAIKTDIEIGVFNLSGISNGMMPSKMIQFFDGDPTPEKKQQIEARFKKKFSGAGNAGKFLLVFNKAQAAKSVEVSDLSDTNLDKAFVELKKSVEQDIYAGHEITSPSLFGIKTEGQLGGSTELKTAYAIFQNTYAEPKAQAFDAELNYVLSYSLFTGEYKLQPTDPVGIQFDVKDVLQQLPRAYVLKELGVPEDMWALPTIGGEQPAPATGADGMVNDNIKNLTGRQLQGIQRIVRKYENPDNAMTRDQAAMLLKTGYRLSDDDIVAFLGPVEVQMSADTDEDGIIAMFDECGDSRKDFDVLKSKRVKFCDDMAADEDLYVQEAFKTLADVTTTEKKIIDLIKKDPLVPADVIARTINETLAFVRSKITSLTTRGYLEETITDGVVSLVVPDGIDITLPPGRKAPPQVYIKYSYEGPQDSRNRPFCAKLMSLNRLYSRAEIERISERLGYSVFDRRGGFWRHKDGVTTPYCRHRWQSNILVKKGGTDVA